MVPVLKSLDPDYHPRRKREWYERNGRNLELQRRYGITEKEFDALLEAQDYRCAICLVHQNSLPKRLNVDHNHETNKVRGLLCYDCNRNFIGNNTDPEKYRRAAEYLNA
jgi:hypothetical protein